MFATGVPTEDEVLRYQTDCRRIAEMEGERKQVQALPENEAGGKSRDSSGHAASASGVGRGAAGVGVRAAGKAKFGCRALR